MSGNGRTECTGCKSGPRTAEGLAGSQQARWSMRALSAEQSVVIASSSMELVGSDLIVPFSTKIHRCFRMKNIYKV